MSMTVSSLMILFVFMLSTALAAEDTPVKNEKDSKAAKADLCVVEDSIWIKVPPARVFKALTEAEDLAHWWPKAAESDPKLGGKIVLTWFNGSKMSSTFGTFVPDKQVGYVFYTEKLDFTLTEEKNGTLVSVRHQCGQDAQLHVTQSWGHLTVFLKCWLEHGIDLHKDQ